MALLMANKIPIRLVNNVVTQGLRLQALACKTASCVPKTRYPLNQQDANSYIEELKAKECLKGVDPNEPYIVRSFNVDVHTRPKPSEATTTNADGLDFVQRFMSSKAGKDGKQKWTKSAACGSDCEVAKKKRKQCKPGRADKNKCPKVKTEGGVKFKLKNCKGADEVSCMRRKYAFVDCKKPLPPYPAFSEACYEPLNPAIHECKDCPWAPDINHPTFTPPINKYSSPQSKQGKGKGKEQKRKFHTDAHRFVTLRFGQPTESQKDRRQKELETKLYDELNQCVFEAKAKHARRLPIDSVIKIKPALAADSQAGFMFRQLMQLKKLAELPAPANPKVWQILMKRPGFRNPVGNPRSHKLRRKRKHPCGIPSRCPIFKYKYKDYDIKEKTRQLRKREEKRRKSRHDSDCSGATGQELIIECAPRGRNMDMHNDMPNQKKQNKLGTKRHKLRPKKAHDGCESCVHLPYRYPIDYDIKQKLKEQRREKGHNYEGPCTDCSGRISGAVPSTSVQIEGPMIPSSGLPMSITDIEQKGMWCKMVPKKPRKDGKTDDSLICDELAPSLVCPKNLVPKPFTNYPKYRKQAKKRLAKEKKIQEQQMKKRHYRKQIKKGGKKKPKKKAAGLDNEIRKQPRPVRRQHKTMKWSNAQLQSHRRMPVHNRKPLVKFTFKPLPEEQATPRVFFRVEEAQQKAARSRINREEDRMETTLQQIENMILAKNRIRVTGPPICKTGTCDRGSSEKKKCNKKIKPKICPVDLLDRKPYKKYREGKKKRSKKGKKGKHAAALEQETMEAEAIENTSREAMVMSYQNQTARAFTERPSAQ